MKTRAVSTPARYKNMTYSVAVSWLDNKNVEYEIFPDFKTMFDIIINEYGGKSKIPRIFLNAHNTNKYDNHFLRKDLLYFYPHMTSFLIYFISSSFNFLNIHFAYCRAWLSLMSSFKLYLV